MKLANKVAVITGGNSGIGLAIAQRYQQEGAKVAIFGRNADTLTEAADLLGDRALVVRGDVTKQADLDALFSATVERFGKVDAVVANAGVVRMAPAAQTDEATFDLISDINFKGAFFTVKTALPHLEDGGAIVFTSSAVIHRATPGMAVYAASKAAVRTLASTLAAELAPRRVRVNVLSPGAIETPIFGTLGMSQAQLDGMVGQFSAQIPLGRFGRADEMAKAAVFLASDDASYVTGSELVADGGFTA